MGRTIRPPVFAAALAALVLSACPADTPAPPKEEPKAATNNTPPKPDIKADKGVDLSTKTIKIGTLNDESGPAAKIGKPYALGKRVLVAEVNAGGSGLLPEGWKLELVERDHAYNPQQAKQRYKEIKDDVLFIGTSFGTPMTLPLRDDLTKDNLIAFPASLSSKMAEHPNTPPIGPAYFFEAMRAMDWAVEKAGGADKVKAAIIFQQDDYGQDGANAWSFAAKHHGVEIVAEESITTGQKEFTATFNTLKEAEANVVLLTVLPSATAAILGTAAALQFTPTWIGNTPSWSDGFFSPEVVASQMFSTYYLTSGLPFWGEELPGMDKFNAAFEKYRAGAARDGYVFLSYLQGRVAIEAAKRAIEAKDITRDGYKKQLATIVDYDLGGLMQKIDLSKSPYVVSTKTRILKPTFEKRSWEVVGPYAVPKAYAATLGGADAAPKDAPEAADTGADQKEAVPAGAAKTPEADKKAK